MNSTPHDRRLTAALTELDSLLVPGEALEAVAVQRRLFALLHRRTLVAATSGRLIGMRRGLIGGFHPVDVRWQDLEEAELFVGIFGAKLTLHLAPGDVAAAAGEPSAPGAFAPHVSTLVFDGLRKDEAQAVYRICQTQEQSWREKRRIRELEEMRARAGGVHIGAAAASSDVPQPVPSEDDAVARLERAKVMLEKGLITDAEFESIKAKIINSL